MSSSHALCGLSLVMKEKHDVHFFHSVYIKQLSDLVFMIYRINKVLLRDVSLSCRLQPITPTSASIIMDIIRTSTNNIIDY